MFRYLLFTITYYHTSIHTYIYIPLYISPPLVFQSTLKGDYPIPSSLPPSALSLITSLLNTDPLLRPGVATSSMATHINPIVDTAAGSVQPPPIGNTKTGSSTSTTPTTATPPTTSDTNTTNPTTQTTSTPSQASQQLSSSSRYSSLDEIESLVNETAIKAETSQSSSYTTFTSIKTHPFFEGIDWDNLFNQQVPRIDGKATYCIIYLFIYLVTMCIYYV